MTTSSNALTTEASIDSARSTLHQIEAYRRLSRAIRDAGSRVGLGQLQIEILLLLHEHQSSVLTSRTLLPTLAVRLSTLSEALISLHEKRLIRYIPHRTDHRRKFIEISSLGRTRVRRFFRYFDTFIKHRPAPRLA